MPNLSPSEEGKEGGERELRNTKEQGVTSTHHGQGPGVCSSMLLQKGIKCVISDWISSTLLIKKLLNYGEENKMKVFCPCEEKYLDLLNQGND